MAGIKIVDLPAVGRDLAATDLFEMSLVGGTGSRKITGQEIMNASKLSVNNTPVINGTSGRIFFQDAANVLQQSGNLSWDSLNNTLNILGNASLNNIFAEGNIIVDTANVWLSNGFAIGEYSTGNNRIEFYTTKLSLITNGNDVMTIFNSGNVAIGTTTDAGFKFDVNGSARVLASHQIYRNGALGSIDLNLYNGQAGWQGGMHYFTGSGGSGQRLTFYSGGVLGTNDRMSIFASGNVAIGTTTDNGFRFDVNGTSRVRGLGNTSATNSLLVQQSTGVNVLSVRDDMYVTVQNTNNSECFQVRGANDDATIRFTPSGGTSNIILRSQSSSITLSTTANAFGDLRVNGGAQTLRIGTSNPSGGGVNYYSSLNGATHSHRWFHNNVEQMTLQFSGNLLLNTTTDAGFRLDVNGTAIVRGVLNVGTALTGLSFSGADCAIFNNGGSGGAISLSMAGNTYFRVFQPINAGSGITSGTINTITTPIAYAWASGTASPNLFQLNPNYNFTGTYSGIVRGFYYNPSLSSMTGVTHYAIHSTSGRVRLEGLPTSPTGLSAGDLYNDGGTIKIV
jgi:hypothetical protein